MEEFFVRQDPENELLLPIQSVFLDEFGAQVREDVIMPNPTGAIHDTVLTEKTGQDDLLEAFRKLHIAFKEILDELDFSAGACRLHEDLLVNGAGRDAEAALVAPVNQLSCLP